MVSNFVHGIKERAWRKAQGLHSSPLSFQRAFPTPLSTDPLPHLYYHPSMNDPSKPLSGERYIKLASTNQDVAHSHIVKPDDPGCLVGRDIRRREENLPVPAKREYYSRKFTTLCDPPFQIGVFFSVGGELCPIPEEVDGDLFLRSLVVNPEHVSLLDSDEDNAATPTHRATDELPLLDYVPYNPRLPPLSGTAPPAGRVDRNSSRHPTPQEQCTISLQLPRGPGLTAPQITRI